MAGAVGAQSTQLFSRYPLGGAAEARPFFERGCTGDRLVLGPHQQAQAHLASDGAQEGLGCRRRKRGECPLLRLRSGLGGIIQPEVLTDIAGPLRGRREGCCA